MWGQGILSYQRAVRTREWLYIRTIHPGCIRLEPAYLHRMDTAPTNDTEACQHENLAARQPEVVAEMDHRLSEWKNRYTGGPDAPPDPMEESLHEGPHLYCKREAYVKHLRALGRPDFAEDLLRRTAEWGRK